ncbi:MAG: WS/DGAT domain-containing protein [Candidatus Promineifilaceae bacterium]
MGAAVRPPGSGGVSILSYAGSVELGIAADAGLVLDPDAIIEAFYAEFETFGPLAGAAPA